MKQPQVKDRFGLVYGILVVLGVGTLLPLNVFLTEKEFFDIRLHVEPVQLTVANNFLSLFGLVFNGANLLAVCFIICLQQNLSLRSQIVSPLAVIFIVLASTAALALRLDLSGASVAYYSLPALAVLGMCMAVLQGGVLNLASMFPPIYIQLGASSSGEGGRRTPADVAPAAFIYFGAAAAITGLCVACFSMLTGSSRAAAIAAADRDLTEQLLPSSSGPPPGKDPDALPSYAQHQRQQQQQQLCVPGSSAAAAARVGGAGFSQDYYHTHTTEQGQAVGGLARDFYLSQTTRPVQYTANLRATAAAGWRRQRRGSSAFISYALSMVLTMGCSLAVWPGITAFICSVDNPAQTSPCAATSSVDSRFGRITGDLFVPITFVVFGQLGALGQAAAGAGALIVYALLRFGVAYAILHCHVVTPTQWRLPTLFHSDLYPLAFITVLGLTQGHLLSTACMHAPALVPPGREGEFGPVTGCAITAGSLMGSAALFLIMQRFTAPA
ncbi:hypothetical protein COO60DRAFT_1640642 [Scenedesmus sp. NREL 46B-D3]|nr:hypothetical protein COO60DRAFT_1640642 [Scenedesmus sp. NREL 46B-D3]